jgi:hypothetical protein
VNDSSQFTTTAYGAPAHLVTCTCGFTRTVNDDAHADAVLAEHTLAHQVAADGYGTDRIPGGWGGAEVAS